MGTQRNSKGKDRFAPVVLAAAVCALALPGAGLAVVSSAPEAAPETMEFLPFTPAGVDPELAARVAAVIGEDALRFTPATKPRLASQRTVNFAVRVDKDIAASISGRAPGDKLASANPIESVLPVTPTRYNLGVARGYQSFAQPTRSAAAVPSGIRDIAMPDLSSYRENTDRDEPSRFQSRIELGQNDRAGSSPLTIEGSGSQQLDLGGSYSLSRNLDVTAGVRLKQERDRLAPLTNGVEDDQAVYVGTQIRF
ncbi:hypothetical protein GRI34_10165 [Erythrobacter aquimaris]|uniref:Porin n=1 Tax=Qipengyuania aquimaris TaxID=255984 RepID=A0A6I4TQ96_9SPHN|nr:hypothetical protein [Qipengyuania aquimaris]MXO96778.1 hypothetical protein [Qipengyuania aquimaris]